MPTKRRARSDEDERTKKGKLNTTSKVHLAGFFATPSAALPSLQAIMDDDDEVPCGQPCKPQKELNIRGIELPPDSPGKDMTEDTVELPPFSPRENKTESTEFTTSELEEFVRLIGNDTPVTDEELLTESNCHSYEAELQHLVSSMTEKLHDGEPGKLGPQGKRRYEAMLGALKEGGLCPRSTLGVQFRAEHPKGSPDGDNYLTLKREEAKEFRLKWLERKMATFREKKVFKKSWQRIDTTKGEYLPLGAIIIKEGGWSDRSAIRGAIALAQKCVTMGEPWYMKNPQTGRINYLHLSFCFTEEFKQSWMQFKEEQTEKAKLSSRTKEPVKLTEDNQSKFNKPTEQKQQQEERQ